MADDPATPLLWVLRDRLNLTGTKYGCGAGLCGACTVLVDRTRAERSCQLRLADVAGAEITPIEGLAAAVGAAAQLQQGWIAERITNICRCGTYPRIRKAIHRAAGTLVEKGAANG